MNKRQPDISVVMTVYNGEEFLEEAIESILTQTYSNFEFIIVVESGCNLSTLQIVQKYKQRDERVYLLFNDKHLGLAESLNVGIRFATGTYIARMDDDDISMPTRFEKQRKFMMDNPDVGLCGCLQMTVKHESESVLYCATEPEELKAEMLFGCQLSHTSVMFRRKLFMENDWFYEDDKLAEDFNLWLRILDKTKIANLDEVLVKHRFGFANISVQKGERLRKENMELIKCALAKYLHIDPDKWMDEIFCAWRNFSMHLNKEQTAKLFFQNLSFLQVLDDNNKRINFISPDVFRVVLFRRFRTVFNQTSKILGIEEIRKMFARYLTNKELDFRDNMLEFVKGICCTDCVDCMDAWNQMFQLPHDSKIIIWGTGQAYKDYIGRYGTRLHSCFRVVGIGDSRMSEQEKKKIERLFNSHDFDYVLISTGLYFYEIKEQLITQYGIERNKIGLLSQMSLKLEGIKYEA